MVVVVRSQPGSILVVEDDPRASEALTELLEGNGYSVQQARNGQEALLKTKIRAPNLILLDLSMPVMDGWEFMRQQRLDPSIAEIPVVVITALISAVPAGTTALLTKPINVRRLMSLVEKFCSPRG